MKVFCYSRVEGKVWNCQGGFIRGGNWNNGADTGAFTLNLNNAPSNTNTNIGLRCASDQASCARTRGSYLRIAIPGLYDHRTFSVPILSRKHNARILVDAFFVDKVNRIVSNSLSVSGLVSR